MNWEKCHAGLQMQCFAWKRNCWPKINLRHASIKKGSSKKMKPMWHETFLILYSVYGMWFLPPNFFFVGIVFLHSSFFLWMFIRVIRDPNCVKKHFGGFLMIYKFQTSFCWQKNIWAVWTTWNWVYNVTTTSDLLTYLLVHISLVTIYLIIILC